LDGFLGTLFVNPLIHTTENGIPLGAEINLKFQRMFFREFAHRSKILPAMKILRCTLCTQSQM